MTSITTAEMTTGSVVSNADFHSANRPQLQA
jgi:hypothetical protein